MMGCSLFVILSATALLPKGECFGKGGYPVRHNGKRYDCEHKVNSTYCQQVCNKYNAGYGYCNDLFKPACYCEELIQYGGYPVNWKGYYYKCQLPGENRWCQFICKDHDAGYGYCYGIRPYCYCEGLTEKYYNMTVPPK